MSVPLSTRHTKYSALMIPLQDSSGFSVQIQTEQLNDVGRYKTTKVETRTYKWLYYTKEARVVYYQDPTPRLMLT